MKGRNTTSAFPGWRLCDKAACIVPCHPGLWCLCDQDDNHKISRFLNGSSVSKSCIGRYLIDDKML